MKKEGKNMHNNSCEFVCEKMYLVLLKTSGVCVFIRFAVSLVVLFVCKKKGTTTLEEL